MTRQPTESQKKSRGRNGLTRFPGICQAAKDLGVCRQHIYFVLTGVRRSPRVEAYAKEKGWPIETDGEANS
jgi:hypothetical protein